ncbi:oligosaccharyl transferase STT3 subunit domain-containing protein [Ditylenchus destructor]|uniref:Dolichyl-diphosphooligosaccharide--protein glycosyltransferase subunit STT3A n=1 Tax=Ditylenchus destructor TaxID=166010 RepID=A0AAD4R565_9BILA|nr:oligosaccharyl transferase STT3 subunit domain-containing protein [Ditylenchus destructor]
MTVAGSVQAQSGNPQQYETLVKMLVLTLSGVISFSVRLYAVIRFESVIHEFDPYFNYRTTKYLTEQGYYAFHNWFDEQAWYPLGRIIGGTIYPGLMVTSLFIHRVLIALNVTVDIREVCVFLAPLFSSFTVLITYHFTKEIQNEGAGLVAAALIAIVPGYISRSVAGSYDNELLTYYLWIKSVKTGSVFYAGFCALSYFYMVSSWGGYVFLINLIPLHVLVLICTGRFSHRVYIAYSTKYANSFRWFSTSFYQRTHGGLWDIWAMPNSGLCSEIAPWTGRFYSLLDPSYAKNNIPIIASVSEHQPTAWSSFYFDLQFLVFMFPVGLYFCFKHLTDQNIFAILYGLTSIYFAGVMVRLMLVLAPIMCVLGGIAVSGTLSSFMKNVDLSASFGSSEKSALAKQKPEQAAKTSKKAKDDNYPYKSEVATAVVGILTVFLISYAYHCNWVTSEAYSSPSIVLSARSGEGRVIFDDFRESYFWLRKNTPDDAKIMSWWDYGYQITAMANRTVLVDNNTWNNTHISRVGQAMSSNESHAYEIMRELDVDYVLVIFGGVTGYSSDDINKFLWMVRIGGSTPEGHHIKERDYYTKSGEFRVDREGSPTMLNCLMYKLCYYRFGAVYTEHGKATGYDRVRRAEIGNKDFELEHLEEAYTTEHWIVRIYRVLKPANRKT